MCFASLYVPTSGNQGDLTLVWLTGTEVRRKVNRLHVVIFAPSILADIGKMLRKIWFKDSSKERRKFIPALWKTLPTNPWYSHGYKNGSRLCQYLHG